VIIATHTVILYPLLPLAALFAARGRAFSAVAAGELESGFDQRRGRRHACLYCHRRRNASPSIVARTRELVDYVSHASCLAQDMTHDGLPNTSRRHLAAVARTSCLPPFARGKPAKRRRTERTGHEGTSTVDAATRA
jgi:hypothetical protein